MRPPCQFMRLIALPLCFTLAAPPGAWAQTAAEGHVEDVVVTSAPAPETTQTVSEKQVQALQSAPVAATVVTQDQIQNLQINNIQDAKQLAPSLTIKVLNVQNLTFNIRGIGNADGTNVPGSFSGVPIYIDGIYYPRPGTAYLDIPDMDGLQVLKGPQGTAGGWDSTAGAVKVTTLLPSFTTQRDVSVTYGNYNQVLLKGSVTGAIADTDWAAFRLSLFGNYQDGWIHSVSAGNNASYGEYTDKAIRAQVLLRPIEDLTVRLVADYSFIYTQCCVSLTTGVVTNYANGAPIPNNFYQRAASVGYIPQGNNGLSRWNTDLSGNVGAGPSETGLSTGVAAITHYNLNGNSIDSVTAFRRYGYNCHWFNNTAFNVDTLRSYCGDGNSWNGQEDLSISSATGQPVETKAGVFFLWENFRSPDNLYYGGQAGAWYFQPKTPADATFAHYAMDWTQMNGNGQVDTKSIAPYLQSVWHATPQIDVTAGLRYSATWKSAHNEGLTTGLDVSGLDPGTQQAVLAARASSVGPAYWSQYINSYQGLPSGLISISYKVTPDIMPYVSYGHGARPGGPNISYGPLPDAAPTVIKPETLDNYEIGLKTDLLDHKVQANFAAFWMNDWNFITQGAGIGTTGGFFAYTANAPHVISRGFEADVRAHPTEEISVNASGMYDDAFYQNFPSAPCPVELGYKSTCSLTGQQISATPRWSFNLGAEYTKHLGAIIPNLPTPVIFFAGPDYSWQSWTNSGWFGESSNSIYAVIPAYGILNAHAGLKAEDGSWNLTGWVHNALNAHYFLVKSSNIGAATGLIGGTPGNPLMAGLTYTAKF